MKRFLSLLTVLAFVGISTMWGTQVTSTFTSSSLGVGSGQPTWTSSTTPTAYESDRGVSWSKASTNLTNTSLSTNTITSVVVTASANGSGGNITVSVGGTAFSSSNATISNGDSKVTHTFTHAGATGNIVVGVPQGGKSIWIKSITVTYTAASCSNKLTVTKTAPTNGSFNVYKGSVSNSNLLSFTNNQASVDNCGSGTTTLVVVPQANTHYHIDAVTATNKKNGTSITESNGQYSIQYAQGSNVSSTITVTFEEDEHSSIVLNDANGDGDAITNKYVGDTYTLPTTAASCTGKNFVGWSTVTVSKTNTKPTSNFYEPGATYENLPASIKFYAVYAKVTESTTKFKRVTSVSDITEGDKVAIVNNSTSKILGLNDGGTGYTAGDAPTETSSQIDKPSNNNLWTASKSGDYWEFTNCNTTTKKIATSNYASQSALNVSTQTYTKFEIGANSSSTNMFYLRLYNGSSMTNCALQYYSTNSVWQVYAPQSSGNPTYSSNANVAAKLYVPVKTYSAYATGCEACDENPTIGAAGLKSEGAYGLDGVEVSVSGMSTGSEACEWTDYGFYWGTSANKKANKKQVGTSGDATSFEATLAFEAPTQLAAGTTYYFCAYGKNSKSGAAIVYGAETSFTPYTVSYNNNGGSGTITTQVVNTGGSVTLPSSGFTKNGHHIDHWALNSTSGASHSKGATYSNITANAEFYAIWAANPHTLTWSWNNGSCSATAGTEYTEGGTVNYGSKIDYPSNESMSRTGYNFNGWSSSPSGNPSTMPDQDLTITAQWQTILYTITYNTNGGDAIAAGSYTIESNTFNLPIPTRTGYTFAGWKANSGLTGDNVTSIAKGSTGNKEYWAAWTANTYEVVFHKNGGQGSNMQNQSFTYDEAAKALSTNTYTPAADSHKYFYGWNTNQTQATAGNRQYEPGQSVQNLTSAVNGTVTLYAVWKDHTYTNFRTRCCTAWDDPTLSWSSYSLSAGGDHATKTLTGTTHGTLTFESSNESVITVDANGEVTPVGAGTAKVTATWVDGDEVYCEKVIESSTFTVTGNVVVTFKKNGGTGTDDQTQNIPLSTATNLKTLAQVGYTAPSCKQFVGWNTDKDATSATHTDGQSVTLTEGMTLYAIWEDITYTITKGENTGAATFTVASSVTCGEDLTITCAADDDHEGNPTVTATGTHGDITVNSATSVTIANVQSAMTVTISYAAKVTHALKFMNYEEGAYKATSTKNLYAGVAYGELPTLASSKACDGTSTTFKGWTTSKIEIKTATEPTYISAETLMGSEDVEVYAVWAKATPTGTYTETKIQTLQYDTWTYNGSTTDKSNDSYRMFHENAYVQSAEFDLSKLSKVNIYGGYFGGKAYKTMTIDDGTNTWKDVTLQESNSQTNKNEFTGGNALTGTGSLYIRSTCGAAGSSPTGIRLTKVEIYISEPNYTYSDYVTGCRDDVRTITVADNIVGGTVEASAAAAFKDDVITLTKTPASGYNFGSWAVVDANEGNVTVTNDAFTMPDNNVTVNAVFTPKPVESISLSESSVTEEITAGSKTLTASYLPNDLIASQKTLNWTSSNEEVATVDDGVVTYVSAGTSTITASWTQNANVKSTCDFTIYQWNLRAVDPYEVTTTPGTEYTDVSKLNKSAIVVKANYVRSDNSELTNQVTLGNGDWTAKLGGTEIAHNYAFKEADNGKVLAVYVGENKLWEETIAVTAVPKYQFVVNNWDITAPATQVVTYTMPSLNTTGAEVKTGADACEDHNIFVGWVEEQYMDEPEGHVVLANASGTIESNKTFYAVWAKQELQNIPKTATTSSMATSASIDTYISYGAEKGSGTTNPAIYNSCLRLYKPSSGNTYGGYITISASNSYNITAVEISTSENTPSIAYRSGSYSADNMTNGSVSSGKFTLSNLSTSTFSFANRSSDAINISQIKVTYSKDELVNVDYITECVTRYDIEFYKDNTYLEKVDTKKYKDGKVVAMPGDLGMSKEYHSFAGWKSVRDEYASIDQLYEEGDEYTVTGEDYIYGVWNEWGNAAVTFMNGEDVVETQPKVYRETNYTTPDAPVVANKLFMGWSDGVNTYAAGVEVAMPNPAEPITYNATWKDILPTPTTPQITAADLTNGKWILVTANNQVKEGDVVIVATTGNTGSFAMSTTQQDKYRDITAATILVDTLTATDEMAKLFVQVGYGDGQFALYAINGTTGYLYYPESGNELKTGNDLTSAASWTISINANNYAVIQNSANTSYTIRYNPSNPRFSCYTGTQQDVALYKWVKKLSGNTNVSDITLTDAVIVTEGSNLAVDAAATLDNLTVETGGNISGSAALTVNNLIIKTKLGNVTDADKGNDKPGQYGQITNNNISASGDVWIEIELTHEKKASWGWYAFSVPFPVDAMNGVYYGETKLTNEVGYAIMTYHEDKRAAGEYAWKKYRGIMQPGVLYIITVGDTDYKTLRFKKVSDAAIVASNTVAVSKTSASGEGVSGWNGLGNPNLQVSNFAGDLQFFDHAARCFRLRLGSGTNLSVGSAFMYQHTGEGTSVVINAGSVSGGVLAPARVASAIERKTFEVMLRNENTGRAEDNVMLRTSETALSTYEIGRDLGKMEMGTPTDAQMYIPAYGTKLCIADFPMVNGQTAYPLTIDAPAAGSYSLSAEANSEADVYLTLDGTIIWDLSMSAYEFDLAKGTTEGYGLLLVQKSPSIATGVDEIEAEAGVQKIIVDDKVFILRGGKMYDVTGKMVK